MKFLSLKKAFILAVLALFVTVHGAASGAASSSLQSSTADSPSSSERHHAQFMIFIDQHAQEKPNNALYESVSITNSFARTLRDVYYSKLIPFIVSDSIIYNFLELNKRSAGAGNIDLRQIYSPMNQSVWSYWDIYKVNETGFTLFVPRNYEKNHPNHGLLLGSQDLIRLPNDSDQLLDFFSKSGTPIDVIIEDFASHRFEPVQLRKIFKVRSQNAALFENDTVPIWDIIIHGHGGRAYSFSSTPEKFAMIAGISAVEMQRLFKFFNDELNIGALLLESCSIGGENINLLQFDHFAGNKLLLNLNFTVIVASVSDASTYNDAWVTSTRASFFGYLADPKKSVGSLVSMLAENEPSNEASPHGSRRIPQVWVPGGYGFQTYQVDKLIKVLSKAFVAAHEDEKRDIDIPATSKVVLLYPDRVDVPINIYKVSNVDELNTMPPNAWPAFPTIAKMIARMPNQQPAPYFFDSAMEQFKITQGVNFISNAQSHADGETIFFPQFISMIKTPDKVYHSFKRVNLKKPIGPEHFYKGLAGVMYFVRDALIDIYMNNRSDKFFMIDELEGPNDLLLLLESRRILEGDTVASDLEMELRSFVGKNIVLKNLFVHLGPSSYKLHSELRIGFVFAGKAWILHYNPRTAKVDDIAWKFTERSLESHMQEYDDNLSKIKVREKQWPSISTVLKKRIATEQALARMKERIRRQVQSMLKGQQMLPKIKGAQVPTSSSSIHVPK